MATIVNTTPAQTESGSNNFGIVAATLLIVGALYLFFVYGLPMVKQSAAPQITVPEKIDINVKGVNPSNQ